MISTGRFLKRALATLTAFIGSVAVLIFGAYFYVQTDSGRVQLAALLADQLSGDGTTVGIDRISGNLFQRFGLQGLTVEDLNGEWFRTDTVQLEWRPFELIDGRLHITRLVVSDVFVSRQPEFSTDSAPEEVQWPRMPFSVDLDAVELNQVTLAQPILGQSLTIDAAGNLSLAADGIVLTSLRAQRVDGESGFAALEARFEPSGKHLQLKVEADAPVGGVLSTAFDLPGLAIRLSGAGPVGDWRGTLQASSGDAARVEADLGFKIEGETYRFNATGNADVALLADARLNGLVEGGIKFTLDVASLDLESLDVAGVRIESGAVTARLSGTVSTTDIDLTAALRFSEKGSTWLRSRVDGLTVSDLEATVQAHGALLQPEVEIKLGASMVDIGYQSEASVSSQDAAATFNISFGAPLTRGGLPATIHGNGNTEIVAIDDTALTDLLAGKLNWAVDATVEPGIQGLRVVYARIENTSAMVTASGYLDLNVDGSEQAQYLRFDTTATVPDIARFGSLLDAMQGGSAQIHTSIQSNGLDAGFTASIDGTFDRLELGSSMVNTLVHPALSVHAEVLLDDQGAVSVRSLTASSEVAQLSGALELSADLQTLHAEYQLQLDRLSGLLPMDTQGYLTIKGSAKGPVSDPAIGATVALFDIVVGAVEVGSGVIELEVDKTVSSPSGRLIATIDQPLADRVNAATRFEVKEWDELELRDIAITANGSSVEGALRIPFTGAPMNGTISGNIGELDRWSKVAGLDLSGNASFEITASTQDDEQTLGTSARIEQATVSIDPSQRIVVRDVELKSLVLDPFGSTRGTLMLQAGQLQSMSVLLQPFSLNIDAQDLDHAAFVLSLEGQIPAMLKLNARGDMTRRSGEIKMILNEMNGGLSDFPLHLDGPATLTLGNQSASVDNLSLAVARGYVRAQGSTAPGIIHAEVAWDQIPLSLLDLLDPGAGLVGTLAGNLQLSGSRIDPSGKLSLKIADLQQNSPAGRKLPKLNGSMRGDWKGGRLQLGGSATGFSEAGLKLDADVPMRFADNSLTPLLPSTEPLSARASWHGPIEPLVRLMDFDEHDLSGIADLDVELVGTLDSPKAKGTVKLEQGVYEHHGVGTLLKDISLTVQGNGDRLTAKGTATDGGNGRVRAAGFVELASAAQPLIDLELELDKVTLIRLEEVRATASGKLAVTGTLTEARLEGELVTDQVEARIIDNAVPQVTELEVTEINHAQRKPTTDDKSEDASPITLAMDLDLRMPGKVFVRGGGLDSEWSGQLDVTGTADSPIVSGVLRPVRGGFTLAGKRFTLRSGSVRFDGSGGLDPALDLPLEHNGANITAIISITGRASAPQMKMTSRPPLPESEILSRVLFGTGSQQLTTAQKIELAGALASLSGTGAGALDKARDRLGVDVLSVNESADGSTTKLKAGKYVSDRVYVEMEKGAQQNTGTATVEVEIAPRVRVQTGSKGQGEGKVGIEWRWDY